MESQNIVVAIGGVAGAGIMESGHLLAKYALASGLFSFMASEYPSLIRGGHNFAMVHITENETNSLTQKIDILVALNEQTVKLHERELKEGSAIIYDSDIIELEKVDGITIQGVPLTTIAKESGGEIIRNTVAIGAAIGLLKGNFSILEETLKSTFEKKGQEVIDMNVRAALKGYRFTQGAGSSFDLSIKHKQIDSQRILLNGNDAICIGAIRSGLKFAAIYPMTPVTSILDYLAAEQNNFNLVVKEPEDEISAIIMTIGASYSGARSLTATSGGGFCLMTEGLGLAGMAEIPLVVVEGMRSGPSSAMPTKTEQSDLDFVLYAGHGEFPRIVLAPGDPTECIEATFNAFNLADKYQLPVIILTDKYLASSLYTINKPDMSEWKIDRGKITTSGNETYSRYELEEDGVSSRLLPGSPGAVTHADSYEHDALGRDSDDPTIRISMMEKRMKKINNLAKELPEPILYGEKDAEITIFGWGSNKSIILDALKLLDKEGIKANYLHLLYVMPFPAYEVAKIFDHTKAALIVENNYSGQMTRYIRSLTGRRITNKLLKFDGRPFLPEEIVKKVKSILNTPLKAQADIKEKND
ncbi:MAG: 2-oxoacid:acceptor oxidoreductase subunit alpha [bacterium]|nr:2-oxoacid:acceptor oxidoreductase subunit alpha [bacterium]